MLEEALRAEVERVVLSSSAAALGPATRGETNDESQIFKAAALGIPYVNAVHEAEAEALRLAAAGLPLVCVNPTVVFGPGDIHVTSTRLVRSFLLGRVPAYADGAINVVDVRDVATGHLLADEHGEVGERYILGGRNFTFDRLFSDLGRISGVEPPLKVPRALAAVVGGLLPIGPGRTTLTPQEVAAASRFWTYRSNKAKRELGWAARPHEETLEATVAWYLEREHDRHRALAALAADPVPRGRRGDPDLGGRRGAGRSPAAPPAPLADGYPQARWPRSIAARRRRTASAAAARSPAGSRRRASSSTRCGSPTGAATGRRSRS